MGEMKPNPKFQEGEFQSEPDSKFYARACARLSAALGERPTPEQIRRLHEDAESAFGEYRLARRTPELERWRRGEW